MITLKRENLIEADIAIHKRTRRAEIRWAFPKSKLPERKTMTNMITGNYAG